MPLITAAPLRVTRKEEFELQRLARSSSLPHRVVVKASALLLAADGMANEAIARECSTNPDTVRRWRVKFHEGGSQRSGLSRRDGDASPRSPSQPLAFERVGDPATSSSPWILRYPQVGYSLARRSTMPTVPAGMPGRPERRGYVHRRRTRSRCHLNNVSG
jgi:hypothetical protein